MFPEGHGADSGATVKSGKAPKDRKRAKSERVYGGGNRRGSKKKGTARGREI